MDAQGAFVAGGRWNRKGTSVLYCSILVHVKEPRLPIDYAWVRLDIPENLVENDPLHPADLQDEDACRETGTDWIESDSRPAVRVPSAIIPSETNLLLKPLHGDMDQVSVSEPSRFSFDPRLLKLGPILLPKEKRS